MEREGRGLPRVGSHPMFEIFKNTLVSGTIRTEKSLSRHSASLGGVRWFRYSLLCRPK